MFWHNLLRSGHGDFRTRHAGCPVLKGWKWGKLFYEFNALYPEFSALFSVFSLGRSGSGQTHSPAFNWSFIPTTYYCSLLRSSRNLFSPSAKISEVIIRGSFKGGHEENLTIMITTELRCYWTDSTEDNLCQFTEVSYLYLQALDHLFQDR